MRQVHRIAARASTLVLAIVFAGAAVASAQGTAPLTIATTSPLPAALQGQPYTLWLTATGGSGKYSWSSSTLPAYGLTLDSTSGAITGTPNTSVVNAPITIAVSDGASAPVTATLTITIELLQLRISQAPAAVNLSDPGSNNVDWVVWGVGSASPGLPLATRSQFPQQIGNVALLQRTNFSSNVLGNVQYSWNNGTSAGTSVAVQTLTDIADSSGESPGFTFTVVADTSVKTLNLYVGAHISAYLDCGLSDTVTGLDDQSVTPGGESDVIYSIDFRAASPNQTLTITLISTDPNGYVALQAAALQPHLPQVTLTSPQSDQLFSLNAAAGITMTASQYDSALASGQIWEQNEQDSSIIIQGPIWQSNPPTSYSGTLAQSSPGTFQFQSQMTDAAGLTGAAPPVEAFVIGSGGMLSELPNPGSSDVIISDEGTADWVLFGPTTPSDGSETTAIERKSGFMQLISDYTSIGNHSAFNSYCCGLPLFDYSGGTAPNSAENDVSPVAYNDGVGNGFQFTVNADQTLRNLRLYAGVDYGTAKLQAFLSDGSAPPLIDSSLSNPEGLGWNEYVVSFQAASAGQTLTVRYTLAQEFDWGDVKLFAVDLDGAPIPLITLTSSANPSTPGGLVTVAATVTGYSSADGSPPAVMFVDGGVPLGLGTLVGANLPDPCATTPSSNASPIPVNPYPPVQASPGAWSFVLSTYKLQAGSHSITAELWSGGQPTTPPSPVLPLTVSGSPLSSVVVLQSSAAVSTYTAPVTLAAALPMQATGAVAFCDGISGTFKNMGWAHVNNGNASLTLNSLAAGSHPMTALYTGDGNYVPANATLTQVIAVGAPIVALSVLGPGGNAAPSPAVFGTSLTLQATMSPSVTGTVTFMDGGSAIGTASLVPVLGPTGNVSAMVSSYTTSTLNAGSHVLTAAYSGDPNNSTSSSLPFTQAITASPVITGISSPAGAAGTSIVIAGSGFGLGQSTSTIIFNGIAATATAWSDGTITATVPNGPVTGNIVVTVGGQPSNGWPFAGTSPAITSISPRSAPVGMPVTINGMNFGANQGASTLTFSNGLTVTPTSWSDTQIVAVVPSGATNGPVTVQVGGYSTQANFYVQSPLLQIAMIPTPGEVNLSNPVNLDWAIWGADGVDASITRDAGTTPPLISDITVLNGATVSGNTQGYVLYDWSNGTPIQSGLQVAAQVVANGLNNGFQITVPANTSVQTLTLFAGVHVSAQLTASISDKSSPPITAAVTAGGETDDGFSIDFRAASAGQTLTVMLIATDANGYVALQAATLSPHLPNATIAKPTTGFAFIAPATIPVDMQAWQYGASMADVQVSDQAGGALIPNPMFGASAGTLLFDWQSPPYGSTWSSVAAGHYQLQGQATDVTGLTATSLPTTIDVIGSGGSLSESLGQSPPSVDLTQQGTADWVLFGPTCNTAVCAQSGLQSIERKAGVSPFISPYITIGNHAGALAQCCAPEGFAYEDGTPAALNAAVGPLAYMDGVGNGFELTVNADTNTRTLWLYASADYGQAQLHAYLSDGSAVPLIDQSLNNTGSATPSVYSITYNAASAGQTLTVLFTLQQEYDWGDVELYAAALTGPPTVAALPSGVSLSSSPNPSQVNGNVTFTAVVSPPDATGILTVWDGSSQIGIFKVTGLSQDSGPGNTVIFNTTALANGPHAITASYSGNTNYAPSTSTTLTQTVGLAGTLTELYECLGGNIIGSGGALQPPISISACPQIPVGTGTFSGKGFFSLVDTGGTAPSASDTLTLTDNSTVVGSPNVQPWQTTNLLSYSETMDGVGTGWQGVPSQQVLTTVMTGALPNPMNGLYTASEMTIPALASADSCEGWLATVTPSAANSGAQASNIGGQTYTFSIWLKAKSSVDNISLAIQDIYTPLCQSVGKANISVGPDWHRYSLTYTFGPDAATAFNILILSSAPSPVFLDAWGAQVELASFAGPYVPTYGAPTQGSGGIAAWNSTLTAGSYTAVFGGDSTFNPSSSIPLAVGGLPSPLITLVSSPNPATFGQAVTFTVNVARGAGMTAYPSGEVDLYVSGTEFGGTYLNSVGSAALTFTSTNFGAGYFPVSVYYWGDKHYGPAESNALQQQIGELITNVALSSNKNPSTYGEAVTFTAVVTSSAGPGETGTVAFYSNWSAGTPIAGCSAIPLTLSGTAACATAALMGGTDQIVAVYSGDSNFLGNESEVMQIVNPAATSTAVASSPSASTYGQSVTLTATVAPAQGPSGTVAFTVNGSGLVDCPPVTINSGTATCITTDIPAGQDLIVATYSGDNDYATSTGKTPYNVGKATTTTVVTSSTSSSTYGQTVSLTATVGPKLGIGETGSVSFNLAGTPVTGCSSVTLSSYVATCATSALPAGSDSIIAVYSGDNNFDGSTSDGIVQTVAKATLDITASSESMPTGGTVPPFNWTASGFVNHDTRSVLSGSPNIYTYPAVTSSTGPGLYTLYINNNPPGNLTAQNYIFSFTNGILTVTNGPNIIGLSPPTGPIGKPLTITGTNFGPAYVSTSYVTIGGVNVSSATIGSAWGPTSITFTVPTVTIPNPSVAVVNDAVFSNSLLFPITSPFITGVSSSSGYYGQIIQVIGTNFEDSQGASTITVNGVAAPLIVPSSGGNAWTNTQISFYVPCNAPTSGNKVVVTTPAGSASIAFTVDGWACGSAGSCSQ